MSMSWSQSLEFEPKGDFPNASGPPTPADSGELAQRRTGSPIRVLIVDTRNRCVFIRRSR